MRQNPVEPFFAYYAALNIAGIIQRPKFEVYFLNCARNSVLEEIPLELKS